MPEEDELPVPEEDELPVPEDDELPVPEEEDPLLALWVAGEAQSPFSFVELPLALSALATCAPASLLTVCSSGSVGSEIGSVGVGDVVLIWAGGGPAGVSSVVSGAWVSHGALGASPPAKGGRWLFGGGTGCTPTSPCSSEPKAPGWIE